ncbi:hypothetical protein BZA05DRAFT_150992 [Tricharina praecox]|uniref:uncharacterized protein n=1 Tax=Tricharina praecox TaxID=43433 RepID=UPI00221F27EC|nr:uncharacterized protein BZA05DRAFT_150992 [Tricharina praecox]KAI5844828.1 hypothetical protein BZA05DRAFT_150992 [Tricharina praecox]
MSPSSQDPTQQEPWTGGGGGAVGGAGAVGTAGAGVAVGAVGVVGGEASATPSVASSSGGGGGSVGSGGGGSFNGGGRKASAAAVVAAQDPHNNGARAALTNEIRSEFFRLYGECTRSFSPIPPILSMLSQVFFRCFLSPSPPHLLAVLPVSVPSLCTEGLATFFAPRKLSHTSAPVSVAPSCCFFYRAAKKERKKPKKKIPSLLSFYYCLCRRASSLRLLARSCLLARWPLAA